MTATRVEAYLTALAKTAGREFAFDGSLVLTDGERDLIAGLEHQDFADDFQRAIAVRQAMMRLDFLIGSGSQKAKSPPPW